MADPTLLNHTDVLIGRFNAAILNLRMAHDPRIFFTLAHAYITRKIRKHIGLFAAPDPLLRLNESFATTFLNAIEGSPTPSWQRAFRVCASVKTAEEEGFFGHVLIEPESFELCGACMAKIHITRDLRDALTAVKGIDPQDYGNVLIFVTEGQLYAEGQIRGGILGTFMFMGSYFAAEQMNMNAKIWRNQVFTEVYRQTVPDPSPAFVAAYHSGEGR